MIRQTRPSEVVQATRKYCGAVAVSAYEPWGEFEAALRILQSAGVRTNVHYVLSAESLDQAIEWLKAPPPFLKGINALVFLNFKPVSRTNDKTALTRLKGIDRIREVYQLATGPSLPFRVGFDSCMVAGLAWHADLDPKTFEACEAGRFSMFVSEEMQAYPCSFMVEGWEGVPVTDTNLLEIWQHHPRFQAVRGKLLGKRCAGCRNADSCMGGCPLFAEINLCEPFIKGDRRPNTVPQDRGCVSLTVSASRS